MRSCEEYREWISCLCDGELTQEQETELEAHVAQCEECRAMLAAFRALSGALEEALAEPPETICENVMTELRREKLRTVKKRRPWLTALAAAACLALLVPAGVALLSPKGASAPPALQYSAQESYSAAKAAIPAEEAPAEGMPDARQFGAVNSLTEFDAAAEGIAPIRLGRSESEALLGCRAEKPSEPEQPWTELGVELFNGREASVFLGEEAAWLRLEDETWLLECERDELLTLLGMQ